MGGEHSIPASARFGDLLEQTFPNIKQLASNQPASLPIHSIILELQMVGEARPSARRPRRQAATHAVHALLGGPNGVLYHGTRIGGEAESAIQTTSKMHPQRHGIPNGMVEKCCTSYCKSSNRPRLGWQPPALLTTRVRHADRRQRPPNWTSTYIKMRRTNRSSKGIEWRTWMGAVEDLLAGEAPLWGPAVRQPISFVSVLPRPAS